MKKNSKKNAVLCRPDSPLWRYTQKLEQLMKLEATKQGSSEAHMGSVEQILNWTWNNETMKTIKQDLNTNKHSTAHNSELLLHCVEQWQNRTMILAKRQIT